MNSHVSEQFASAVDSYTGILNQSRSTALDALSDFAGQAHSMRSMHVAFGRASDTESIEQLLERMKLKDTSLVPNIEILPSKYLKNGHGAFSDAGNTIYLSNKLFQEAGGTDDIAGITSVLLEETGHYFDSLLNSKDSAGDEGEIFSKIVQGELLSSSHLNALKLENDAMRLTIDGQNILVEMSRIETIEFKDNLYQSMRGTDNQIFIRSSTDGVNWGNWQDFGGRTSDDPEFEVFGDKLIQSIRGTDNGIYTRYSYNGGNWSPWQWSGETLDAPELEVFGNKLMQSIRGTDDGIYTRYSYDGVQWNQWQWSGRTLDTPELEVFQNKLFQSVQGTDNRIYTRYSYDGNNWFNWVDSGATPDSPELEAFGNKLIQSVRGTDNRIYTRYSYDGNNWFNWVDSGATLDSPELESFNGWLYQTVRGTDNGLYTRISRDAVNWTDYQWSGQTLSTPTLAVFKNTLFQAVEGTDNRIHIFKTDPASWWNHGSFPNSSPLLLDQWLSPGDLLTAPDEEMTYYPALSNLADAQWDQQSGDNNQFEANPFGGGGDQRCKTDDRIEQIYNDLSTAIFGSRMPMSTGYAFDDSYATWAPSQGIRPYHAGIDIDAANNGDSIKSATDGVVVAEYLGLNSNGESYGRVVGIDETDSSGNKTGRRWWYVHNSSNSVQVGQSVFAGVTEIGKVGFGHLHLAVTDAGQMRDPGNGNTPQEVLDRTMSPLHAFWKYKNNLE